MNLTTNKDLKLYAKAARVCLYSIADEMGMQESALSKKLRRELPQEEKDKIFEIIDRLAAEGGDK